MAYLYTPNLSTSTRIDKFSSTIALDNLSFILGGISHEIHF